MRFQRNAAVMLVAAMLSFGVTMAIAQCTHLGVACPGWGAGSQQAQQTGYCCVAQFNAGVPCPVEGGIKGVTVSTAGCGQLRQVVAGQCSATNAGFCALIKGTAGCASGNCP